MNLQRRIYNPVKYLCWRFLQKQLTAFSRHFVGDKAKARISRQLFQESKARQIF